MKKIIFPITFIAFLFAQQAEITNIQASMRNDGSGIIDITYDLLPDPVFEFFEISVKVSIDAGENFINMENVSGDLGDIIEPGNNKILTWDFRQQFGEMFTDELQIEISGSSFALINNNNNQEIPFEMVTVPAGEYTFGENDEIRTIDYDYEIMKYEVTDQDYVLFMLDKLNNNQCQDLLTSSGEPWINDEMYGHPNPVFNHIFTCNLLEQLSYGEQLCDLTNSNDNNNPISALEACCVCGGGTGGGQFNASVSTGSFYGYYPGDANYPAGEYTFLDFSNSKISFNGEIFEVEEGNVNHPVTGVTWFGAWAFATYYGMEVPDQYEWEKAARGNTGYDYPWGNNLVEEFPSLSANFMTMETTSIGSFDGDDYLYDEYYEFSNLANIIWYRNENNKAYVYLNSLSELGGWTLSYNGDVTNCIGPVSTSNNTMMWFSFSGGTFSYNIGEPIIECDGYISEISWFEGATVEGNIVNPPIESSPYASSIIEPGYITTINSISPYGNYDMAGNVWEIVKNDDDSYFIRGGAYSSDASQLQSWYQESYNGSSSADNIGFRCMRKINQSQYRTFPKEKLKEYYINKKNNTQKSNIKK